LGKRKRRERRKPEGLYPKTNKAGRERVDLFQAS
jgi:hypothetical protein